jgi:cation diffusion facilitator CzcD-associated flavoprotein CzcO
MASTGTIERLDCAVVGTGKYIILAFDINQKNENSQKSVQGRHADRALAGWYGLAAAKQYHCTCPKNSLVVFESQSTLGGTWADHRLYPGLKSNNLLGTYEYPDFPMDSTTFKMKPGQAIPGEVINTYLKAYAANFKITDLIRFRTNVLVAEHQDTAEGGWMLTVANSKQEETKVFARRLIIATGLTSEAFLPHFDGQETFGGNIFHSKHFQQNSDTLQTAKSVTVFGGSKFAWDAVYAYATAGVKVDWVIRCKCYHAAPEDSILELT